LQALASLAGYSSVTVLQSMLREQNEQLIDEVYYLLAGISDPGSVEIIAESLASDLARVRANAVEALESLTSPQMAALIVPLTEPQIKLSRLLTIGRDTWGIDYPNAEQAIRQLVVDPEDPWLRAVMTFTLGEMGAVLSPVEPEPEPEKREAPSINPLDRLSDALAADERPKPRRAPPADLLGSLMDDDAPSDPVEEAVDEVEALPTPIDLKEIKALIAASLADPVADVRVAANAANRMIAGLSVTDVAQEEETVLSTIERIIFLKEVPFFGGMTVEQLKVLADICEEEVIAEDTRIFEEGDPGGVLYVIVSGQVAIERGGQRKGSIVRLATIGPRAYFGEMAFFDDSPRSAAAVAIQDTLMLKVSQEPLVILAQQNPDLSLALIRVLSQRLREANDRIAGMTRARPSELERLYDKLD